MNASLVDIEAPFDDYMQQCRDMLRLKMELEPVSRIIFDNPESLSVLESIWYQRYFLHHSAKLAPKNLARAIAVLEQPED